MRTDPALDDLWRTAPRASTTFDPAQTTSLPEPARRYLRHAIQPGTPLHQGVRLRMHGQFRLKDWIPFTAEQVIAPGRGTVWSARMSMKGIPISGYDRVVDGEGSQRWRMLGLWTVAQSAGEQTTRSTLGRLAAELVWLPTALCGPDVKWTSDGQDSATFHLSLAGEMQAVTLDLDADGRVRTIRTLRWGTPPGGGFRQEEFGGLFTEEQSFGPVTIPVAMQIGWWPGEPRFEGEGAFFEGTVTAAEFAG